MQYRKRTFGDYVRIGTLYVGMGLSTLGMVLGFNGCRQPSPPDPDLTEAEGVQKVKQVLGNRGITVESYGKMIRISDPVTGYEVEFFPDLGNEGTGVYAEYMSDTDSYTSQELETIRNILSGPGIPAMIAVEKGTADEVENGANSEAGAWGL